MRCPRCKRRDLTTNDFYYDYERDRPQRYCKQCIAEYKKSQKTKQTRRITKPKVVLAEEVTSRTFRTHNQQDFYLLCRSLSDKQNGLCPLCQRELGAKPILYRDETERVLGLLCPKCRLGLESFNANPDVMRRAVKFVETR